MTMAESQPGKAPWQLADELEQFLGIEPGGHRDPSQGEAMPRWPEARSVRLRICNILDANTGDVRLVNDDGTPLPPGVTFLD